MKPIDKKDMPKLIAFIVLAVVAFGFAGYQLVTALNPPAQTAAVPPGGPPTGGPGVGGGGQGTGPAGTGVPQPQGVDDKGQVDVDKTPPLQTGGRDPFVPTMATVGVPPPVAPPPSTPAPHLPPAGKGLKGVLGDLFNKGGNKTATPAPPPAPVIVPPAEAPQLKITGIILGEEGQRDVAILQGPGGEEDRRFALLGDEVGNGYVVMAIHARGIDISDRNSTIRDNKVTIKLGQ